MKNVQDLFTKMEDQICWRAWDGRLPSIFFELGGKLTPKDGGEPRQGEYSICLMGCPWKIRKGTQQLASHQSEKAEILLALNQFIGQRLRKIILTESLIDSISFSGELEIEVSRADNYEWSIVTPQEEVEFTHSGAHFFD